MSVLSAREQEVLNLLHDSVQKLGGVITDIEESGYDGYDSDDPVMIPYKYQLTECLGSILYITGLLHHTGVVDYYELMDRLNHAAKESMSLKQQDEHTLKELLKSLGSVHSG